MLENILPPTSCMVIALILGVSVPSPVWTLTQTSDDFSTPHGQALLKRSKAADIKSWMDTSCDPCQNFYNFACGKWRRINSAQSVDHYSTNQFHDMARELQKKTHKLLSDPTTGGDAIVTKLKDFYGSCMKTGDADSQSDYLRSLKSVYHDYGEFSYFSRAQEEIIENATPRPADDFVWWSSIAKIQRVYGKPIIISVDVLDDFENSNRTVIYLGAPSFDMTQTVPSNQQIVNIQNKIIKYLSLSPETAKEMTNNLMSFEYYLSFGATITRPEGKPTEDKLTLYNTTDLIEEYKDLFDVQQFLAIALDTAELPEQIYIFDKTYMDNLRHVFNTSDSKIVQNYILWLLLEEYFVNASQEHLDEWCMEKTKNYFGKYIDHAVYQQYRSEEYEQEIYKLWEEIKQTFKTNLMGNRYDWMSNATRESALDKLDKMNLSISSYDHENFTASFKDLQINASNYVANIDNILRHSETLRTNKLESMQNDNTAKLSFTPAYSSTTNTIQIPVTLLQPYRVWDALYPKAIKYATLGFLLAHEMIHGFDDEGRHYDAQGQLSNWWDDLSAHHFESRRRCFQAQYHNYSYAGHRLPDSIPQHENIADNAGIKLAYHTYERWLKLEKQSNYFIEANETFPNLDYNNREIFFLSYAQLWCEDVEQSLQSFLTFSDEHSPSMYRVIGSLANFHDFSWIFKCDMKADTPMNPSNKCDLY